MERFRLVIILTLCLGVGVFNFVDSPAQEQTNRKVGDMSLNRTVSHKNDHVDHGLPVKKGNVQLVRQDQSLDLPKDPYLVQEANLKDGSFQITVTYSGGCKRHEFLLTAKAVKPTDTYPTFDLFLSHNGNGDLCEMAVTETWQFDLSPLDDYLSDRSSQKPEKLRLNFSATESSFIYHPSYPE